MIDEQIILSQVESHLWESANILLGPVNAADFKPICDVWDDEYQEIVDETGDEQLAWFPESHQFQIPEDCHWNDVRTKATNVGASLQRAMREIEKANPDALYGVFGDAQWSNKERLSDALLKDLIEHFSKLPLGNHNVTSDLLGDAYEYLIKKFADATNKKAGEFYTPRSVVRLMIETLGPEEAETIYDPACGTGGVLLTAVQHVKEMQGDVKRLWGKLYGQEKNLAALDGDIYRKLPKARMALMLRLEALVSDGSKTQAFDYLSLEHVLPQTPPAGSEWITWFPGEDERDAWTHRLANLAPLHIRKNPAASNYDFTTKGVYFKGKGKAAPFVLSQEVRAEGDWTPTLLVERQKRLVGVLVNHWKLAIAPGDKAADAAAN